MARESVLVTGISGFVGRHLAVLLSRRAGLDVHGTILSADEVPQADRLPGVKLTECRLEVRSRVEAVVRRTKPSVVYHLAAQSSVPRSLSDPEGTFSSNVMGTLHLLEALRSTPHLRALVLISSAEVYGIVPESALPLTEDRNLDPTNPYACSKACADLLGAQYFKTFSVPVIRLRPFNHIGPGQADAFAASSFARQIAEIEAGVRAPKILVGNLEGRRDFTDVRDIVRAYTLAADGCVPGEVYNICSGKAVRIGDVLDKLLALSSQKVEVAQDPKLMRPSDLPVLLGDCSKFKAATGWSPEIPLAQTLRDLLDYWRGRVA